MHSITWATATLLLSIPQSIAAPWQQTVTGSTCDDRVKNIVTVRDDNEGCPTSPNDRPYQICRAMGQGVPCFPVGQPGQEPVAYLDSDCTYFATCFSGPFITVQATGFDKKPTTCWAPQQVFACTRNFIPPCQSDDAIQTGAAAGGQPSKLVVSISADLVQSESNDL